MRWMRLAPRNSLYRFVVAKRYQETGNELEAIKNGEIAAKLGIHDAKNLVPLYNKLLGDLLVKQSRYVEAERTYERALAQFSAYAPNISMKKFSQDELDIKTRLTEVRQKLAEGRPSQQWIQKDMPWFKFGKSSDKAVLASSKSNVRDLEPKVRAGDLGGAGIHKTLADSYFMVGRTNDAVIEYLAVTELDAKDKDAWQMLGAAYARQNRLGDAANAFLRSCKLGNKYSCDLSQKMLESMRRFVSFEMVNKKGF